LRQEFDMSELRLTAISIFAQHGQFVAPFVARRRAAPRWLFKNGLYPRGCRATAAEWKLT
jgi:hypothetical protein